MNWLFSGKRRRAKIRCLCDGLAAGIEAKELPQMELFTGAKLEIKTRKKPVEPRTAAQKAYVESLMKNELAFGIGPAGTGNYKVYIG